VGRVISVFLVFAALCALVIGGLLLVSYKNPGLISPIPKVFGASSNIVGNNWFPKNLSGFPHQGNSLSLSANSVLIADYDSGQIIFQKDLNHRQPAASTVKMMTALVAFENADLNREFTVSAKAAKIGEDSMGLGEGEKLNLRDLLYGLILVSGNDAAVTIADGVSGNEDEFVKLMNQKAVFLGLSDTKFINASGLDEDGREQYSTAHDLVVIAHYLWENHPEFREISGTVHWTLDANLGHKAFDLYNDTNLLTTYPGVRGIKPGFTWEAGLCLVTYAENGGKRLLAVILGSDDRRGEMKELLDYGFGTYGIHVFHPGLDLVREVSPIVKRAKPQAMPKSSTVSAEASRSAGN